MAGRNSYPAGANPVAITVTPAGIFGITNSGGPQCNYEVGCGVFFQVVPPVAMGGKWSVKTLYNFGPNDSIFPNLMILGPKGSFYKTSSSGGTGVNCPKSECGTVFQLNPPASAGAPVD